MKHWILGIGVALAMPALAAADDQMFKWRDARGRTHYSNDSAKVPQGASVVSKGIGHIGGAPIGAVVQPPDPSATRGFPQTIARFERSDACVRSYDPWALPHRSVDLDRRNWYQIDLICGPQRDIEGWLRSAALALEFRRIGM
jgi:hypothetical protein